MADTAIRVQNLSKCYQIYAAPNDRLKQFFLPRVSRVIGKPAKQYFSEFWALRNVSFEIKKGETVGIVGRNGSGKSTLLQMICGTLTPTNGDIQTYGRVAALLELGSGFNPEFTGRENVYLNASVLGLSTSEIDQRFDAILDFAEIGPFIERPLKTYSSGMIVRLAFAVAINVDPEILVVDEALSVGDELFQRKCFSRIESIKAEGATILFVSHSGGTIVDLCDRAILLDSGERLATGTPKKIVASYQRLLYAPHERHAMIRADIVEDDGGAKAIGNLTIGESENVEIDADEEISDEFDPSLAPSSTIAYESRGVVIDSPALFSQNNVRVNIVNRGQRYFYRYTVQFEGSASNVRFGMMIKTVNGIELGGAASAGSVRTSLPYVSADSKFEVEFEFTCTLNAGIYFLNAGVVGDIDGTETYLHRILDVAMFRVKVDSENLVSGLVDFSCSPRCVLIAE